VRVHDPPLRLWESSCRCGSGRSTSAAVTRTNASSSAPGRVVLVVGYYSGCFLPLSPRVTLWMRMFRRHHAHERRWYGRMFGSASRPGHRGASASRFTRWRSLLEAFDTGGMSLPSAGGAADRRAGTAGRAGSGRRARWYRGIRGYVVQKYGGTSVADPDRIRAVAVHVVPPVGRARRRGRRGRPWARHRRPLRLSHEVSRRPSARELVMLPTPASASPSRCCACRSSTRAAGEVSFTGSQPDRHRRHPRQGEDRRGEGRPHPRTLAGGDVVVVAGFRGSPPRTT